MLLCYVCIYFHSNSTIYFRHPPVPATQRSCVCYDENPPLFPRIDTNLIRVVETEPYFGFGVAASTICVGAGLFSIDATASDGELLFPYGGIYPTGGVEGGKRNGDYLICAKGILEDGAEHGLGRFCNDRLDPDLCNSTACVHKGRIWLRAIKDIFPGDEITIYYGWDYWKSRLSRISVVDAERILNLNENILYLVNCVGVISTVSVTKCPFGSDIPRTALLTVSTNLRVGLISLVKPTRVITLRIHTLGLEDV